MTDNSLPRRQLLYALGIGTVGAVAGCTSSGSGTGTTTDNAADATGTTAASPATSTPTDTTGGTRLNQSAKIIPDDGDSNDNFGCSIGLSRDGTTALFGAQKDEDPNGQLAGSTYVFAHTDGEWTERAKLVPNEGSVGSLYGLSVALSGDGTTALVGARGDQPIGAAYVFSREDGSWTQRARLTADDGDEDDDFGDSVSVSGDGTIALVGARTDEDPNGEKAGSVYVFSQTDGAWTQAAKLAPDDGDSKDRFGSLVELSDDGTTALIGAGYDEDPNGQRAGSAYVYSQADEGWTQRAKLAPDDGDAEDLFGSAGGISGDGTTVIVGASNDEGATGPEAGSAYLFSRAGGDWTQQARLTPDDRDSGDGFGSSICLSWDGTTTIIGADDDEDPNGRGAGSAYVFSRTDSNWTQGAKLVPDDGDADDHFGESVDLSGDGTTAIAGSWHDEDPHGTEAGSAYVFEL